MQLTSTKFSSLVMSFITGTVIGLLFVVVTVSIVMSPPVSTNLSLYISITVTEHMTRSIYKMANLCQPVGHVCTLIWQQQ